MSTLYNFTIVAGASHCIQARALDSDSNPVNLTNYGVRGGAKYKFSDNSYAINLNPTIITPTGGLIQISISGFQSSGLKTTIMPFDLESYTTGTSGDNITMKILRGYMFVEPEVSNF